MICSISLDLKMSIQWGGFGIEFFWNLNSQIPNPGHLGFSPKKSRKIPNPRDSDFRSKIPKILFKNNSFRLPEFQIHWLLMLGDFSFFLHFLIPWFFNHFFISWFILHFFYWRIFWDFSKCRDMSGVFRHWDPWLIGENPIGFIIPRIEILWDGISQEKNHLWISAHVDFKGNSLMDASKV